MVDKITCNLSIRVLFYIFVNNFALWNVSCNLSRHSVAKTLRDKLHETFHSVTAPLYWDASSTLTASVRKCASFSKNVATLTPLSPQANTQGPEEICLSLEHQNPSKTSEIMGYFDRVDDRVTVSLHILYTANQETEGSQDRLTV